MCPIPVPHPGLPWAPAGMGRAWAVPGHPLHGEIPAAVQAGPPLAQLEAAPSLLSLAAEPDLPCLSPPGRDLWRALRSSLSLLFPALASPLCFSKHQHVPGGNPGPAEAIEDFATDFIPAVCIFFFVCVLQTGCISSELPLSHTEIRLC